MSLLSTLRRALARSGQDSRRGAKAGVRIHDPKLVFYIRLVRPCGLMEPSRSPSRRHRHGPQELRRRGVSADPLSQGNDDPLWPANVGHAPDVLVLTDAADQAVAVRSQPVDRRLQVVDFE